MEAQTGLWAVFSEVSRARVPSVVSALSHAWPCALPASPQTHRRTNCALQFSLPSFLAEYKEGYDYAFIKTKYINYLPA